MRLRLRNQTNKVTELGRTMINTYGHESFSDLYGFQNSKSGGLVEIILII